MFIVDDFSSYKNFIVVSLLIEQLFADDFSLKKLIVGDFSHRKINVKIFSYIKIIVDEIFDRKDYR